MSEYRLPFGVFTLRKLGENYSSPLAGECGCQATKRPAPELVVLVNVDSLSMSATCPDCGRMYDMGSWFKLTEGDADVIIKALDKANAPPIIKRPPSNN